MQINLLYFSAIQDAKPGTSFPCTIRNSQVKRSKEVLGIETNRINKTSIAFSDSEDEGMMILTAQETEEEDVMIQTAQGILSCYYFSNMSCFLTHHLSQLLKMIQLEKVHFPLL